MEILNDQKKTCKRPCRSKAPCRERAGILAGGLIFIAIGVLLLLRNLGAIDPALYRVLLSWQMLLVVAGIWLICARHLVSGVLLAGVGAFFMIPLLTPVGNGWTATYWPFIFILLGLIVIIHLFRRPGHVNRDSHMQTCSETDEGFVDVDNSFGMVRHIVLDPVFEGARIRTKFSGTVLDLKRTALADGETYIDVDMTMSGLEIHVPEDWTVEVNQVSIMMAGIDDKRYYTAVPDSSRRLVVRGKMTLSGIEIKS